MMTATDYLVKLKANGSETDWLDLEDVFKQYQSISAKLTSEDRGPFAVNVLCILCRNIEKVPSWPSSIDLKTLLTLAIECMRCARNTDRELKVKMLACAYHLHKCVSKQTTQQLPPEVVLKLSYMPFENTTETLLKEYCKTYWNLLADRIAYIEKLKMQNMAINKLFTKLVEDVLKVIEIYETVAFCYTVLTFLVLKLHALYADCNGKELNNVFGKIFQVISLKNDVNDFKKLSKEQSLDFYCKFNECLYVMAENSSKMYFKDSLIGAAVRSCVSILGHETEILHCYQSFYLNTFCALLVDKIEINFAQTIVNSVQTSCENTKKIGYEKSLNATLPFMNQLLRLYIEYFITNKEKLKWTKNFNANMQETVLNLMGYIMGCVKTCNQQLKCENCKLKTGLHDALRLSFSARSFISTSIEQNIDITRIIPIYYTIVNEQYLILKDLCTLGCYNYEKCYKKLQTDIHNTAITLNKSKNYEYSIKLFDVYLVNEIQHFKSESDMKNISRSLYNKSICELDFKLYENALNDAYLSLVFAQPECLSSEKHMSLVMDIKAKALKAQNEKDLIEEKDVEIQNDKTRKDVKALKEKNVKHAEDKNEKSSEEENVIDVNESDEKSTDYLQLMTVLDACEMSINDRYGNLKPFFCNLKFSVILKHEFKLLTKLWPSIIPIAGIWRSLLRLQKDCIPWLVTKEDLLQETLYEVILETSCAVRTIHSDYYCEIVKELVEDFQKTLPKTPEQKTIYASLLFLKSEYDLHEASKKYSWKVDQCEDSQPNRTMAQEHVAVESAIDGLRIWMDLDKNMDKISANPMYGNAIHIASLFVPIFSQLNKMVESLQLAHICCRAAQRIDDKTTYLRNASTIIHHMTASSKEVEEIIEVSKSYAPELIGQKDVLETALVLLCEFAMYYVKTNQISVSARLVQLCQAYILDACEKGVKVDVALGKLLEAQSLLCTEQEQINAQTVLSAVNTTHRHYVGLSYSASTWSARRYIATTIRHLGTSCGLAACARAKAASLLRRARVVALSAVIHAAAVDSAKLTALTTNTHVTDDTQVKIDSRLKYILGLPSNDQTYSQTIQSKTEPIFTPKHEIETMLENMTFKKTQLSPSLPPKVPGFKVPDFFTHANTCRCYACESPASFVLICQTIGLEASMYYRAKEFEIAKNYFEGCLKCFSFAESKLKSILKRYKGVYEIYIVDVVEKLLWDDLRFVELEVLIENAFFELSQNNDRGVDEKIVAIHEILQEYKDVDAYLRNEVYNLLIATAKLRQVKKLPEITDLEIEMEHLKLSPTVLEPPKTPEMKPKNPPKVTKQIVGEDEIPNSKRKVIKLNLDEDLDEKEVPKRSTRRNLKIPVLVVQKPELEIATPRPKGRLKNQTKSLDENISNNSQDFATPKPKRNAKNSNISDSFEDFVTPKPKTKIKIPETDINVSNLELTTQKPKKIQKSATVDLGTTSILGKTSLQSENSSILDFATPKTKTKDDADFFTPKQTPADHFYTPMSSLKTYSKKSLRTGIIKNLETEFSTPNIQINDSKTSSFDFPAPSASKSRPRKVETGSVKSLKDKRSLKRATSPGKLEKSEKKPTGIPERVTRLRKPVRFSIDSTDDE